MSKKQKLNYTPFHFDKDGELKPPSSYFLATFYILKAYIIAVLANAYGSDTNAILSTFYPQQNQLSIALLIGIPGLVSFAILNWRIELRAKEKQSLLNLVRPLLVMGLLLELLFLAFSIYSAHGQFQWAPGTSLVVTLLLLYFVLTNNRM